MEELLGMDPMKGKTSADEIFSELVTLFANTDCPGKNFWICE
jgi:hypothetical protein